MDSDDETLFVSGAMLTAGNRIEGVDLRINLDDDGTLDEIATSWLHIENMGDGGWHVAVGDARIQVTVAPGEQPVVHVYRGDASGAETGETLCARITQLESEIATLRGILASVPAPEDDL